MERKRRNLLVAGIVVAIFGVLSSFPVAVAQPAVVKVGAAVALTGAMFREGEGLKRGYELWAKEVNSRGGMEVGGKRYNIDLILYDDKSDPSTGAQLAERLITRDKVDIIFGPFGSPVSMAVAAVTERYGRVFLQPSGGADAIYQQGYKRLFGLIPPVSTFPRPFFDMVSNLDPGPRKLAVVNKDDLFGTTYAKGALDYAQTLKWDIVFRDTYPIEAQDFTTLLTRMKPLSPEIFIVAGHANDVALFIRQMKELRVNVKAIGIGVTVQDVQGALGKDADYILSANFWAPEMRWKGEFFKSSQEFNNFYRQKYGHDAYTIPAQGVATGIIFMHAARAAGSFDQDALTRAFRSLNIETFFGPVKYNEVGINVGAQLGLLQPQNGVVKLVWPPKGAPEGNKPLYPMPAWDKR